MTSREIIRRLVSHDNPLRFGYNFQNQNYNDIIGASPPGSVGEKANPYGAWGRHEELLALTGFSGEVMRDRFGNIYGRFNGKTKGECIRGSISDWSDFEKYQMPVPDEKHKERLRAQNLASSDKYVLTSGVSLFSSLRDARLIANALADTIEEPEMVSAFLGKVADYGCKCADIMGGCGVDAVMLGDDWGTQDRTFISPGTFRKLFLPAYKRVCDAYHNNGMACFLHSCGYIYEFIELFIEAGVDVFQFDQPDVYPAEILAEKFGNRVCFHSPVDIQKIMPSGDRELITSRAKEMCRIFREKCGGGFIAKDYPTWNDLAVQREWADWAMETIVENSYI